MLPNSTAKNQESKELASLVLSCWDFCDFPSVTMIAGPVQSDGVIRSHSDILAGRIPKANAILPYTWAPILPIFVHTHMCDFGPKKLVQMDF